MTLILRCESERGGSQASRMEVCHRAKSGAGGGVIEIKEIQAGDVYLRRFVSLLEN